MVIFGRGSTARLSILFALGMLGACASSDPEPVHPIDQILTRIEKEHPTARISLAYRDLGAHHTYLHAADERFHAASTMKLPILIDAYRRHGASRIDLDGELRIRDTFRSVLDGSLYILRADSDSETSLYDQVGESISRRELLRLMIVRSSNLATNLMIEDLGLEEIKLILAMFGAKEMKVLRGVEDTPAFESGLNNTTTARALMNLLSAFGEGRAAHPEPSREMFAILEAQEFKEMIGQALPTTTRVASKGGRINGVEHDAAIVVPEAAPAFILVILTEGFTQREQALTAGRALAAAVHSWHHSRHANIRPDPRPLPDRVWAR